MWHRHDSTALPKIVLDYEGYAHPQSWDKLVNYVVSQKEEQVKVKTYIHGNRKKNMIHFHYLFSCHSLKYLDLSLRKYFGWSIRLLESLDLPILVKWHHSKYVTFNSSGNGYAKPFLNCTKLSNLVIDNCALLNGKILMCIWW